MQNSKIGNVCLAVQGSKPKPAPVSPVTAAAVSLTPASMMGDGGGSESALDSMSRTPAIAATLAAKLRDSWQHLLRDRAAGGMQPLLLLNLG